MVNVLYVQLSISIKLKLHFVIPIIWTSKIKNIRKNKTKLLVKYWVKKFERSGYNQLMVYQKINTYIAEALKFYL